MLILKSVYSFRTRLWDSHNSHITYGISVSGSSEVVKKITILSEVIKVTDIYKLQCASFVHDYMHKKLPISFNDSFTKIANPNSR